MEEMVEAAATLIRYFGDALLQPKRAELLALIPGVERAADSASVDRGDFNQAVRDLEKAGKEEIVRTVVRLRDTSNALERQARSRIDFLHTSAANLADACHEYQEAAKTMSKLRKEQPQQRRDARGWIATLWSLGMLQRARNPFGDVEAGQQPQEQVTDAIALTIPLLSQSTHMQQKANMLVAHARDLLKAADVAGIVCSELLFTICLLDTTDEGRLSFVDNLGAVATTMESAVSDPLCALQDHAADLAHACEGLKQAAEAMTTIQRAAAEQRERCAASSWWSRLWRGRQKTLVAQDNLDQGHDWASACSAMQGCGLLGALTVLPYLGGTDGLLSKHTSFYRSLVGSIFACSWCSVGVGVPCVMVRCQSSHRIARLCGRIGMLGITILVIFYCHWSLAPDWTAQLWFLAGAALLIHSHLFFKAFRNGDV